MTPAGARETPSVATTPYPNAYAATKQVAAKPGASPRSPSNGSGLLPDREAVDVRRVPEVKHVIEADGTSGRQVALSGRIAPIG